MSDFVLPVLSIVLAVVGIVPARTPRLDTGERVEQAFRSEVRTVPIFATVRDHGRLVTNLVESDFRVLVDGRLAQPTFFSNDPGPLTTAVLLDVSNSMTGKIGLVRESVRAFIDGLGPDDRIRLGTFSSEVGLSPYLTGDREILAHVLDEEVATGGSTALWGAIAAAERSLATESGRHEILVLTDGIDAPPPGLNTDLSEVERQLDSDEQLLLYAVGYEVDGSGPNLGLSMKKMAERTGGGYFVAATETELTTAFNQIADELRHQYVFGLSPMTDGRKHSVQVEVSGRRVSVKTRGGFIDMPTGKPHK